jgi:hypothetical protein
MSFLAVGLQLLLLCCCVIPVSWFAMCPATLTVFEWKYHYRIKVGMTLAEEESVLGPGTRDDCPPGQQDDKEGTVPIARGDQIYVWEQDGLEIWVGLRDGKVCSKSFDFPSL